MQSMVKSTGRVALAGLLVSWGAYAHQGDGLQQITIQAGRSENGVPVRKVQMIQQVDYGDLDLASQLGRVQLDERIDNAAILACNQLRSQDPLWAWSTYQYQCVDDAIGGARSQELRAIARAMHAK